MNKKLKRVSRIWQIWDGMDVQEAYNGTVEFGYLGLDEDPTVAIRQYEDEPVLIDRNELLYRLQEMKEEDEQRMGD